MSSKSSNRDDIAAGLVIAAIGAGAALVALFNYPLGTAGRMGGGYLPTVLGFLLCGLGLVLALQAARETGGSQIDWRAALRPVTFVLGAVILFALLIGTLGMAVMSALTVLGAAIGSREAKLGETVLLSAAMAFAASVVFVQLLGLPLKIWPF